MHVLFVFGTVELTPSLYAKCIAPIRENMDPSEHNMMKERLVDRSSILLPPLHIKLGLIKNIIKALDKEGNTFQFLRSNFHILVKQKLMLES